MAPTRKIKKRKNHIHTKVLIVGGGAAGMSAALNLETADVLLVQAPGSNTTLAAWNIMIKPGEELKKEMLKASSNMSNKKLLNAFIEHKEEIITDLQSLGIKFRKSNIGLVPDYAMPGLEVKKVLDTYTDQKDIKKIAGYVRTFLVDKKGNVRGVTIDTTDGEEIIVTFEYLLLGAGGISSFFNFSTGEKKVNGSILALCHETGLAIRNIEFLMFHPFLIVDKRLPRTLISGDILTQMEFKDSKGKKFLSEKISYALKNNAHHTLFPEMVREFYLQSLKGKIFGELMCSEAWFENYKKVNEYGFVFKGFKKDDLKKIEINPTFHFSIGGLHINERAETSQPHVYAAGEIVGGLHGSNRIGGTALTEAWAFGKIAAKEINTKSSKIHKKLDIKSLTEIGKHGLTDQLKKKLWRALGPVKDKKKLKELEMYLNKKKELSSEEKLVKNMVKISLMRKESIGSFYREDLPLVSKARSSYIVNSKISFK